MSNVDILVTFLISVCGGGDSGSVLYAQLMLMLYFVYIYSMSMMDNNSNMPTTFNVKSFALIIAKENTVIRRIKIAPSRWGGVV